MAEEDSALIEVLKGNQLAMSAIAEILEKMDSRLTREEENEEEKKAAMRLQAKEKAKEEEKESLFKFIEKAVSKAVLKAKEDENEEEEEHGRMTKGVLKKEQKEEERKIDTQPGKAQEPIIGSKDKIKLAEPEKEEECEEKKGEDEDKEEYEEEEGKETEYPEVEKLKKEINDIKKSIGQKVENEVNKRLKKMGWVPVTPSEVTRTEIGGGSPDLLIKGSSDAKITDKDLRKLSWADLSNLKEKAQAGTLPPELMSLIGG